MATVNASSTQYTNSADMGNILQPDEWSGKLRVAYFSLTQAAAGDAGSVQSLVKLPAGRVRVLCDKSVIANSAFGTSRTLAVGYAAYTAKDGTTTAAAASGFAASIDVSAAAAAASLAQAAGADPTILFESRDGVTINSTVSGGTIPANATLKGYIVYVKE